MNSDSKYVWTNHSRDKMNYYRLTESRIKRVIRHPTRVEEGILEGAVAAMQPAEGKRYSEIWVMYVLARDGGSLAPSFAAHKKNLAFGLRQKGQGLTTLRLAIGGPSKSCIPLSRKYIASTDPALARGFKRIKVITAWRYPGKSPERDPIPPDILREIKNLF